MSSWSFPRAFWTSNLVELFERAAYYAVFIAITLYLTNVVGFSDINAAWIGGVFAAGLYFLPPFTGAFADKIGFRKAIILAFTLLTIGYFGLGALPYKSVVPGSIVILMFGGSFIKAIITGTVAKTSTSETRARAFSIFYGIVNVGSFTGKTLAYPLRLNLGLESINYYAAFMTLLALIVVYFFYRNVDVHGEGKTFKEAWGGLVRVVSKPRLVILILIVRGVLDDSDTDVRDYAKVCSPDSRKSCCARVDRKREPPGGDDMRCVHYIHHEECEGHRGNEHRDGADAPFCIVYGIKPRA